MPRPLFALTGSDERKRKRLRFLPPAGKASIRTPLQEEERVNEWVVLGRSESNLMLRTALLTEDPLLWSSVSASVQRYPGTLLDLHLLRQTLSTRRAALDCDLLIVDLRHGGHDWAWTLRRPAKVPTLAIVPQDQSHMPSPLREGRKARNDITIVHADTPMLAAMVRRFIRLQAPRPEWSARWGNYAFNPQEGSVEIAGQGSVCMSQHKFRVVLSLFLHRQVTMHWSLLHRLAWGEDVLPRAATVAAHASWAQEVLELDGRYGHRLLSTGTHYELRSNTSPLRALTATRADRHRTWTDSTLPLTMPCAAPG